MKVGNTKLHRGWKTSIAMFRERRDYTQELGTVDRDQ